ncbi:MAG: ATP-binding protein [Lachnospiraceae bacterium]|nr:ATP-binding protein [Lachnospiraceae bacterium]
MKITDLLGEATEYDKKQAVERKKVKSWLKSISAFANTAGGILIFGITNDEEIVGLEDIKSDSEFISQKIKERISPFPEVVMKLHKTEEGKELLLLHVPAGAETPYYYIGDGVTEAYIRIGNESVITDVIELKRLVMRGRNSSYDSLMSPYNYEDFSFSKLRERYKSWAGSSMTEKCFESFGIRDAQGHLTNAGALLADDAPIRWSRLFCTRWNGLDKSGGQIDALDSAEYTGSLIILLNEGMSFVKRNMKIIWKKIPDSRIEMPDYCERSVFEALVNALIHRDYLINGSEVHIDIFDDRLVIYSPGGMPDGTQIQERDIDDIPSTRRNPILADVFARLGYMERQGSGLSKICTAYESAANYQPGMEPTFHSNRVEFTVKLPNLNFKASSDEALDEALNEALTENQKLLLDILRANPTITQREIIEYTSLSRSTIQRAIKELSKIGRLERIGSKKIGSWVVKD